MVRYIIKKLAQHKAKQARLRRIAHNREQVELILQGLEERGY